MLIIIVSQTYASKEDRDTYLAKIREARVAERSRAERGNIRYEYLLPANGDEKSVILLEQWETAEDQMVHTKSEHFAAAMELKQKYVNNSRVERYLL